MKKLIVSAFVVLCCTVQAQNLNHFGLKGNVKTLQEELKICSNLYGKTQTKDCSSLTSEKQFTKEGYLLDYKDSLGFSNITREKVETPTGWLETVYNNEDGLKIKIGEHYYNKENVIIQSLLIDKIGTINRMTEYFYDELGRQAKKEEVSQVGGIKEKTISFFDEYGTFVSFEIYRDDVLSDQEKFNVSYKFDEKGNWIYNSVETDFGTSFTNREIDYY